MDRRRRMMLLAALSTPMASTAAEASPTAQTSKSLAARAPLRVHPALRASDVTRVVYLTAARAGVRIVAAGERGVVALSDDDGITFRQAKGVPVQGTLTDVCFVDDKRGWAVGHWGVILGTTDGGETWQLQRSDLTVDQPLFSIHMDESGKGVAVGLWGLVLVTSDAGKQWLQVRLPQLERDDPNLFHVFPDRKGALFVTSERGGIWISRDNGSSWNQRATGYQGSLWSGVALRNGDLVVGGLRGSILTSQDGGATWKKSSSGTTSSITDLIELPSGDVLAVALDGVKGLSGDFGRTFSSTQDPGRMAFTAVVVGRTGLPLFFTSEGVRVAR